MEKTTFSDETAKNRFGGAFNRFSGKGEGVVYMQKIKRESYKKKLRGVIRKKLRSYTQKINITFFYHNLNTKYFIIKQVFQKKQYFLKKL